MRCVAIQIFRKERLARRTKESLSGLRTQAGTNRNVPLLINRAAVAMLKIIRVTKNALSNSPQLVALVTLEKASYPTTTNTNSMSIQPNTQPWQILSCMNFQLKRGSRTFRTICKRPTCTRRRKVRITIRNSTKVSINSNKNLQIKDITTLSATIR